MKAFFGGPEGLRAEAGRGHGQNKIRALTAVDLLSRSDPSPLPALSLPGYRPDAGATSATIGYP